MCFFSFHQSGERREVYHYLYVSWPDFGVPKSASAMLDFREHVLQRRDAAVQSLGTSWTGPPGGPPVVVHCSAGIGRTGMHLLFWGRRGGDVNLVKMFQHHLDSPTFLITWDQLLICQSRTGKSEMTRFEMPINPLSNNAELSRRSPGEVLTINVSTNQSFLQPLQKKTCCFPFLLELFLSWCPLSG